MQKSLQQPYKVWGPGFPTLADAEEWAKSVAIGSTFVATLPSDVNIQTVTKCLVSGENRGVYGLIRDPERPMDITKPVTVTGTNEIWEYTRGPGELVNGMPDINTGPWHAGAFLTFEYQELDPKPTK